MGIVGIVGYAYMRDWNWARRLRHRADQDLRDRAQLHAVGGAAVHPDGQLRHARRHVAGAVPRRLRLHRPPARRPGHGHHRGPRPASAAICGSSIATAATFAKVAYPSMKRFGYSDALAAGVGRRRRHARHPDPALHHHGDLRHHDRDQHRQAVRRRRPARDPRDAAAVPRGAVHHLARSEAGPRASASLARALARCRPAVVRAVGVALGCGRLDWLRATTPRLGALTCSPVAHYKGVSSVIALFVFVMGGIYGGVFTATEGAGVGAFGALIFALARRALDLARRSTRRCSRARAPPRCCS